MTEPTIAPRAYIDRKTGKSRKVYLYKGRPCPSAALASPIARRYAGYSLIHADLLDAKEWLKQAHSLVPRKKERKVKTVGQSNDRYFLTTDVTTFQSVKAFWFAAIVLYGKCFASANGRRVKLERVTVPSWYVVVHDKIIAHRNTIVAHAGVTAHESSVTQLVLSPNPATDRFWLRADINRVDFEDDRDDPIRFASLIDEMIEHVDSKLEQLKNRLLAKEVVPFGKNYWYKRAKASRPVDG